MPYRMVPLALERRGRPPKSRTAARSRDRIVKKSEKDDLYTALDLGCVWLERALAGK